jgi:hypothetical protein
MAHKFVTPTEKHTRKLEAAKMRFRPNPVAQTNTSIHTILQVTNTLEDIAQCQQKWEKHGKDG